MFIVYLAVILAVLSASAGYYLTRISLNPKKWDYDESYRNEVENERIDDEWFSGLNKEDVFIKSHDGLKLHGIWCPAGGAVKTVILSHGYSYSLYGSVKFMKMFVDREYNILLIDQRYHGLSEGKTCTMGFKEKMDLVKWTNWIEDKVGAGTVIGTHGESMGAAAVLMHAAVDERIKFIISDCSYQDIETEFKYRMKIEKKLPAFPLLYFANFFTKLRTGAFYGQISPLKAVKNIKVPVLFIHGDADDYTLPSNTINLHNAKRGPGFLYIAPGAGHADSYTSNPDQYRKIVYRFMDNSGF